MDLLPFNFRDLNAEAELEDQQRAAVQDLPVMEPISFYGTSAQNYGGPSQGNKYRRVQDEQAKRQDYQVTLARQQNFSQVEDVLSRLDEALQRCKNPTANHRFTSDDAYLILEAAVRFQHRQSLPGEAQLLTSLRVQATASPIVVENPDACFLVQKTARNDREGIPVKYQGYHNSEVCFPSQNHNRGIVARRLRKRVKKQNDGSEEDFEVNGKQYCLIQRANDAEPFTPAAVKAMVLADAPALVKFWSHTGKQPKVMRPDRPNRKRPNEASQSDLSLGDESEERTTVGSVGDVSTSEARSFTDASTANASIPASEKESMPAVLRRKDDGGYELHVPGDLYVGGNIKASGNATVSGQLKVSKGIAGQLVTPPEAADYAEWFYKLHEKEDIPPGSVVQLRSPDQRVTLDTSGEGPWLVVSTKPSVAAGVPNNPAEANKGVLCAFIGQVPVRVRGGVKVGDPLMPSGLNDGFAVAMSHRLGDPLLSPLRDPVGTSMEDTPAMDVARVPACWNRTENFKKANAQENVVLSLVRWQHNLKWNVTKELNTAISGIWGLSKVFVPAQFLNFLQQVYILDNKVGVGLSLAVVPVLLNAYRHYPVYSNFAGRDFVWFYALGLLESLHSLSLASAVVIRRAINEHDMGVASWTFQDICTLFGAVLTTVVWGMFYARSRALMTSKDKFVKAVGISDEAKRIETESKKVLNARFDDDEEEEEMTPDEGLPSGGNLSDSQASDQESVPSTQDIQGSVVSQTEERSEEQEHDDTGAPTLQQKKDQ